jgi:metal-dependent amidase/aminoacylase/carboxypeptidase family protein
MDAKQGARERLAAAEADLLALSRRIHARPELAFEEECAAGWLADALDAAGFRVRRGVCDIPTAFVATAGSGPLHVAICAEYDAAHVADDAGLTVSVVGTPAEESGGGKILLLERGAFAGVHTAMMVHPAPFDMAEPPTLAFSEFEAHFHGKASHASAAPELGVNAADALVVAQTAIGLLRQHIRPTDRVHGIVTRGGEAPNIVPAHTTGRYYVRARTRGDLENIRQKVLRCFEAGALATGCTLRIEGSAAPYAEVRHDSALAALYRGNAEALGRTFIEPRAEMSRFAGSTDMGNISHAMPSIHPMIGLSCLPAVNHQPEFTAHCVGPEADRVLLDGALALAWTAVDVATDDVLSARLRARPATGGTGAR